MQGPPVLPAPRLGPQVRSGLINRTQQTGGGGGGSPEHAERLHFPEPLAARRATQPGHPLLCLPPIHRDVKDPETWLQRTGQGRGQEERKTLRCHPGSAQGRGQGQRLALPCETRNPCSWLSHSRSMELKRPQVRCQLTLRDRRQILISRHRLPRSLRKGSDSSPALCHGVVMGQKPEVRWQVIPPGCPLRGFLTRR